MSRKKALYVGGCTATYHQLEPTVAPITSLLDEIGIDTTVTGIYHPNGDETYAGDYTALNATNLAGYDILVLFTTGRGRGEDVDAVLDFVRNGKSLIGIHCAADSFQDRQDYLRAIGGQFRTHPAPLDVAVEIVDAAHPVTAGVSAFTVHDELYLFKEYDPKNVHLLAQTTSFDDGAPIPVSWVREEGKGRIFYVSLGHMPPVMSDPNWRRLVQNGVNWTLDL
ncbi:MAG: ThuA domain-containing protein [Capsulimonadaceae bacterium]|nr:ThuA domain-containing protein [Capsulimonadaceae bacterium]